MLIDLSSLINKNEKIAVAISGGSDSVALLHFLLAKSLTDNFSIVAINVEHGIRGNESLSDSIFVKDLCSSLGVPLLSYSVDALSYSKEHSLSLEESARILRYNCFFEAIENGLCDKVATAHHKKDNMETVLLNLFRGTSLKGVSGIPQNFNNKIIRPFLALSKSQIDEYLLANNLSFVTDSTNHDDKYTRNYIRLNLLPLIEKIFPEAENNVYNFSSIAKEEDEFLDNLSKSRLEITQNQVAINLPIDRVLLSRGVILALKHLGVKKDWERVHVEDVLSLLDKENGKKITLPKNVIATKEYDKIVLSLEKPVETLNLPFSTGEFNFGEKAYSIIEVIKPIDLKSGLYLDLDKIPKTATIRTKQEGDFLTKFGGGTKSLSDFFTDKKIPLKDRPFIPLIADGNEILAIFNIAISNKVKIDNQTKKIIKLN